MKTEINKSVKRAISLVLAFVLLIGTLFTANIGVNIKADAETTDPYADWDNVQCWNGTPLTSFWNADTEGEYAGKYVIRTAAQLQFACAAKRDNTIGKSFVIDPTIDAFIMQPQEAVDELGIAAFVELSGGEETREFFEKTYTAAGFTPVNWLTLSGNNALFNGNFDGSGVPIYGIYADAIATNVDNAGFFPGTRKNESGCMTIENLVIKNCYFKGYRRVSILSGCAWASDGNYATVDSCIFANCYLLGQNLKSDNTTVTYATAEIGLLGGNMSNEPVQLSNTLVYGNKTEYDTYTDSDSDGTYETVTTTPDAFKWLFKSNQGSGTNKGSIKNCIILDAQVNSLTEDSTTYCENVYSDTYTTYVNTVTNMIDNESVKGAHGKYYMSGLDWDDSNSDGLGWWAIKNDYPTPIKPAVVTEVEPKEFEGSGTEAEPYIIRSAKQLDTMVSEGGIRNGVRAHYKVADDVKEIYLNNNVKTKEEAIALYDASSYNNWNHGTTSFEGTFDGNGVTIYGMISSNRGASGNVGFVSRIGATHTAKDTPAVTTDDTTVTIENVNFVGAYINSNSLAAVVSSSVVGWRETSADGTTYEDTDTNDIKPTSYITSVTVRDSYINSAKEAQFASAATSHNGSAGGILAMDNTPDHVVISNCLYDGGSCELIDTDSLAGRTKTAKAGIVSMASGHNELTIENCVAIDEYAIPMVSGVTYANRYNAACQYHFNTVYGKYNSEFDKATFITLANCYDLAAGKTTFVMSDMPLLNWGGAWDLVEYDGRMIPMPKTSDETVDSYASQLVNQYNGLGANPIGERSVSGYTAGTFGMYQEFTGSGTEEDPYIISNALDLARAIACGGKDITTKLYYKLSCDIDVGASWINETTVAGKYVYVPFEGHIDGDGHTIYNLYSVGDNASLIPVIVGGASIKNLHIRNSNIVVGSDVDSKGAFFGKYQSDGNGSKVVIEGCSFEGAGVDGVQNLVGDTANATIINSYYVVGEKSEYSEYYLADGTTGTPTVDNADFYGEENVTDPVWYKGGENDCMPQLVNRAKAMTEVDVSGFGDNDYDSSDIASLRQRLLNNTDYANVYGDVSRNGVTNLSDLVILTRQLVGTYNKYADGFWRNAALGNIVIYYGENDNYDFARKLELALENEFGKDVKKVVVGTDSIDSDSVSYGSESGGLYVHKNDIYTDGTNYYKLNEDASTGEITYVALDPKNEADAAEIAKYALDGNCQIVVGKISGTDYAAYSLTFDADATIACNQYGITYNKAKSAVWLQGGSFTAVEQATLDFINNSNPDSGTVHTTDGAVALDTNKVAIDVDGTPYYYAWGDEFNGDDLARDVWTYYTMHNETRNGTNSDWQNLEVAFPEDIEKLYEINDGKLQIWRGYYADAAVDNDDVHNYGYKYLGAQKTGDNGFGGTVDSDDVFASAGLIHTEESMLVKQGYLEMKASLPSDGYVFACWWLRGFNGGVSNTLFDRSLYGKAFKLNNIAAYGDNSAAAASYAYDGTTTVLNSSNPSTYKYMVPNTAYEIDIAELMQAGRTEYFTSNFTFHKYVNTGIYTDTNGEKAVKFIDWSKVLSGNSSPWYTFDFYSTINATQTGVFSRTNWYSTLSTKIYGGTYTFDTSSTHTTFDTFYPERAIDETSESTWLNSWKYYKNGTEQSSTWSGTVDTRKITFTDQTYNGGLVRASSDGDVGNYFSGTPGDWTAESAALQQGTYLFGVYWTCNDNDTTDVSDDTYTFRFTVKSEDGNTTYSDVTVNGDIAYDEGKKDAPLQMLSQMEGLSDKETVNQYMYMLLDNTYYTRTDEDADCSLTDMLNAVSSSSKATMEIDYVRVYQQDNKRDIVTPDTEEFNNGNHFGY